MMPSYEQIPALAPVDERKARLKTHNQSKILSAFQEHARTQILSDVTSDVNTRRVVLCVPEKSDLLDQAIDYTQELFWSHGIPIVLSDKTYNCEYGDFVVQLLQHRPNSDIKTLYLGVIPSQQVMIGVPTYKTLVEFATYAHAIDKHTGPCGGFEMSLFFVCGVVAITVYPDGIVVIDSAEVTVPKPNVPGFLEKAKQTALAYLDRVAALEESGFKHLVFKSDIPLEDHAGLIRKASRALEN